MPDFDMLVLGSGPGGQKAAIAAAKLGRRVAVVDRPDMVGGVSLHTGTIPSKTLREAVLYLTGLTQRDLYGQSYRLKENITVADLTARTQHVVGRETDVIRAQLTRNQVALFAGTGRFVDDRTVALRETGGQERLISAEHIVIATGTRPARPDSVEFDGRTILDSDNVLTVERVPQSMVIVGAGVIGMEYASMFAALGSKVTVVEKRAGMLDMCDVEVIESLKYHLRDLAVTFRFGETVAAVERHARGALTVLESGKKIPADVVMYSAGRQGLTDGLDLDKAGLAADRRGRIEVDEYYRTPVPHIYAVGDVIGGSPATPAPPGRCRPTCARNSASPRSGCTRSG
ncbi:FAD-dependent oxidoreductase, partial [Streptomyces asoensis]|uniref:FAD-dependent oxidoreductase n=1 Tax=Streptomyces asoensis TaxID=249586 RepID=UPI0034063B8F